jgi:hypothetical protein
MQAIKKRKKYKKKRYAVPVTIIVVLLLLRMYLPTYVKGQINTSLANIPGFYGEVKDVDIALYKGAYVLDSLYLNKVEAKTQVPYLNFPKSNISIEWKSLLKGEIVSEIVMHNPEIIYVVEDQNLDTTTTDVDDWSKALTNIIPIDINKLTVKNGKLAYVELSTEPNIDLNFDNLELTATNLRNVVSKTGTLPSPIHATARSIGGGSVRLDGNINLIKQIPDMDISFALENTNIVALNSFTRHYSGLDFEAGNLNLYCEVAIADGFLKGYVKPLLSDTKLIGKDDGFLGKLWEGFVGFFKFVLKNQKTDTIATKVPLEGDLNNVSGGVWPTVFNIFENAWVKAFTGKVDDEIDIKDALNQKAP